MSSSEPSTTRAWRIVRLLAWISLTLGASANSPAQPIPSEEAAFTRLIAERMQQELPDFRIKPSGRLTVESMRPTGEVHQVYLDRVWALCNQDLLHCPDTVSWYISDSAEFARENARPFDKSMVSLVIQSESFVMRARQPIRVGTPAPVLLARPFAGGFWVVAMLNHTRLSRPIVVEDFKKLGLDEDGVFDLGRRNLQAKLRPLREVVQSLPAADSFGRLAESNYEYGRLILHSEWAPIAEKLNQRLLVMVLASNLVIYGDGSNQQAVDAMLAFALERVMRTQQMQLPPTFRWTAAGWEAVRPNLASLLDAEHPLDIVVEYVRSAPAYGLARSYLAASYQLRFIEPALANPKYTFVTGEEQGRIEINQGNARQFYSNFERRLKLYTQAIEQRGFAQVAGEYEMQTREECAKWLPTSKPAVITQEGFKLELMTGTLRHRAAIVESSIAVEHGFNPELSLMGRVQPGTIELELVSDKDISLRCTVRLFARTR